MMEKHRLANSARILAACVGACIFWTALYEHMRPSEPHPGLRDDELKEALRDDHEQAHDQLSYLKARKYLFEEIDGDGRDAECFYTGDEIEYFKQPLPTDGAVEHAWPMTRLPSDGRSDLHHMYAVSSEARVARVNLHYGDVLVPVWSKGGSRSGASAKARPRFEVRKKTRGDIARSMFYVSTVYELGLPDDEEKKLRRWHEQDPVSKAERRRNDDVAHRQDSRNPFVDHPGLTRRIGDF